MLPRRIRKKKRRQVFLHLSYDPSAVLSEEDSETVSIPRIVALLEEINSKGTTSQPIKYQDCRKCFEYKMRTESNHEDILVNTATLLLKDLNADFAILKSLH
jgi:hypothetical protein